MSAGRDGFCISDDRRRIAESMRPLKLERLERRVLLRAAVISVCCS